MRVTTIYGGRPYEEQKRTLEAGVDVVVGTPGRLLDLHAQHVLPLDKVAILVLDEADEILDLGFLPAIEKLLQALTHKHQTMLFSATMPGEVLRLARNFLHKPVHIRAESADAEQTHATTKQVVFQAHRMDKVPIIVRILQARGRGKTVIFARTKRGAAELAQDLANAGFSVGAVHGDLGQEAREKSLAAFRSGRITILVATDVAARGIDVSDVSHVINYHTPDDPMTYVHRIGRTGRAGNTGTAVTLVGYEELQKWRLIHDELHVGEAEPAQWFSTSPELFAALDIPEDAESTVGPAKRVFGGFSSTERLRGHHKKPLVPEEARPARSSRPARSRKRSGRKA